MEAPTKEVKIIVTFKEDKALVGIQQTDCDPVFSHVHGDLLAVLCLLPDYLADAQSKWANSPRYPKAELPAPPPAPAVTTVRPAAAAEKSKIQTPMF